MSAKETVTRKDLEVDRRTLLQNAKLAIRDVFDATTELVTNSDDRYQLLNCSGRIEIEVERRRGRKPSLYSVRDFADGMSAEVMEEKLSRLGGRVSGLESGKAVRGTNARGAKDVASLGRVIFRSIAADGQYHHCEISPFMEFTLYASREITEELRGEIGITEGTGTLVTIEVSPDEPIPQHDNLRQKLESLVSLRDILADPKREVTLRDANQQRSDRLSAPAFPGTERVKVQLEIPGYTDARAKLIIRRASDSFEREPARFRKGGILVKSRHAIHESTLFDPGLETNPHAQRFFGRLVCPYIDDLSNEFDERFSRGLDPAPNNPRPIVDPSRRSGLTRDHPFVKALFGEALKRLRPLVEEERRREEHERAAIENRATRQRLDKLEKAALEFMEKFGDDDASREPTSEARGSEFFRHGYQVSPPFSQLLVGHSLQMSLQVNQESFPELEVGATVQLECHDDAVECNKRFVGLEVHPSKDGVLRGVWKVTARSGTPATGVRVRVGPITTEATIEIFESEADRYRHVQALTFQRKRYRVKTGSRRKKIRVLAPLSLAPEPRELEIQISGAGRHFSLSPERTLRPLPDLGVAVCELFLKASDTEARGTISARLDSEVANAEVASMLPAGSGIKIKLEDIDLGNQRYRWRQNVLEIAARHASIGRYLGSREEGFPGQDSTHFRLLVAEIVSDALCAQMMSRNIREAPEEYEDADWDLYYAEYSKLMTSFLPIAHQLQSP